MSPGGEHISWEATNVEKGGDRNGHNRVVFDPYKKQMTVITPRKITTTTPVQMKLPQMEQTRNDEWVGHKFTDEPANNVTRFMLVNCNGLDSTAYMGAKKWQADHFQ